MIYYSTSAASAAARTCPVETFDSILTSPTVMNNCQHMADLAGQMLSATPTDSEWKAFKDACGKWKKGSREEKIEGLPGFLFNATFPSGHRSKEEAILNGLVVIDIDRVMNPREMFSTIKDDAIDMDLVLAYISPSSKGLKLVFIIPNEARSLWNAQEIICKRLGLTDYLDDACKDASRLSFASPASYVLYRDDMELFSDHILPMNFVAYEEASETACKAFDPAAESNDPLPENEGAELMYKGVPYSQIIERLCYKLCGKSEPEEGTRNMILLKAAGYLRTICENDINKVMRVMPAWGQAPNEWRATIKSAFSKPMYETRFQFMEQIVTELKAEAAEAEGKESVWRLPLPPAVLPPGFAEIGKCCPAELKPGMMFLAASIFGFYGNMAKVDISEDEYIPKWLTPCFMGCVVGQPASGKGNFTYLFNKLMDRQIRREEGLYELLNESNIARSKGQGKGKLIPIRVIPGRLSKTSIAKQIEAADGKNCYQFIPEIDEIGCSNGSGNYNDLSDIMRKSTDNDRAGQIFMSADSYSCNVPIYLSLFLQAQPQTMFRFFNKANVSNGLTDRVFFTPLPDNTGMKEVKMKRFKPEDEKRLNTIIDELELVGVMTRPAVYDDNGNEVTPAHYEREVVEIPKTLKALRDFQDAHRNNYCKSLNNASEDHYMRRALQIGAKVGMVAYLTSDFQETQEVVDLAVWAAEYDLQSHMLLFGKTYNECRRESNELINQNISGIANVNVFDTLENEFTLQDLKAAETKLGITDSNPNMKVAKWKKMNLITARNSGKHYKIYTKVA